MLDALDAKRYNMTRDLVDSAGATNRKFNQAAMTPVHACSAGPADLFASGALEPSLDCNWATDL